MSVAERRTPLDGGRPVPMFAIYFSALIDANGQLWDNIQKPRNRSNGR